MLHLICGDSGAGKTALCTDLVKAALKDGKKVFYIVPEQQTVSVESAMARVLDPSAVLSFEVTNFTRLANTVFRLVGGLVSHYATADSKALLMYHAIDSLSAMLHTKRARVSTATVAKYLETVREMHYAGMDISTFERIALHTEDLRLKQKLEDLSLIYAQYTDLLEEKYADSEKMLGELASRLRESNPLAGAVVFVDGFGSLTGQQHDILECLLPSSEVHYTLALPEDAEDCICFDELLDTHRRLLECAKKAGVELKITNLGYNKRTKNTALSKLCRALFRVDAPALAPMEGADDNVCTILAQDAFEGAMALAADICKKVENGARYADFAVVCANAEAYKGILDTEFSRCDIPYFLSEKTSLASYEPIKLIYAAYAALGGFAAPDVIAYVKCAFLDADPDACDEFELYAQTWRLNGTDFTSQAPFTMNPDGYAEKVSFYGEEMLKRVNAIKDKLRTSLAPLMGAIKEPLSVEMHLRMLYDFLLANEVPQSIARRAAQLKALGDSECDRYERLWQVICDVLDRMFTTLKDKEVNAATFAALLRVAFENTDIGRIPSGTDEVLIASAPTMRDSRKHLYLFGVVDGEFPSLSEGSGLFDDAERAHLRAAGAALPKTEIYATAAGMYAFYRMLSLANESLTAVSFRYTAARSACQLPSIWVDAIRLLGENHILFDTQASNAEDLLWRKESAVQLLGQLSDTAVGKSLAACFEENDAFAHYLKAASLDLENATCRPSTVLAEKDGTVTLSQSRIEQYVKCPFSYFGKYVLSLKETKAAHFEANHMGTFIHHLLEHYFAQSKKGGKIADKEAFVTRLTDDFMQKNAPRDRRTPETEHLVARLKRLASLILEDLEEEFEAGEFSPVFFELPIGFGAKDGVDAVKYESKDGTNVCIHGFADRVDAYEKDGDVYVRIVDYKTGTKELSTDDLKKGMNLQMLLYMVSIMQSDPAFQAKLGVKGGGSVLPAGVVYLNCLPADVKLSAEKDAEAVTALAKENIKRSGIYVSDKSILCAMEEAVGARFLPISYKKDGTPTQKSEQALKTIEEWNELFKELETTVTTLTDAMRGGMADATPLKTGQRGACDYCSFKPLCRNAHV